MSWVALGQSLEHSVEEHEDCLCLAFSVKWQWDLRPGNWAATSTVAGWCILTSLNLFQSCLGGQYHTCLLGRAGVTVARMLISYASGTFMLALREGMVWRSRRVLPHPRCCPDWTSHYFAWLNIPLELFCTAVKGILHPVRTFYLPKCGSKYFFPCTSCGTYF